MSVTAQRSTLALHFALVLLFGCVPSILAAQESTAETVPHLTPFSGTVVDSDGHPRSGITGITFALFKEQTGGAPLWIEIQNVMLDAKGRYSVQLGATKADGIPVDMFSSGDARWLAIQPEGLPEQPRVMLVSVPYALKAADAETVGGLPASAFVLRGSDAAGYAAANANAAGATALNVSDSIAPATASTVTTNGGTVNAIPLFSTATNIQNSLVTQTGTTAISVGGTLNLPNSGTATASKGFASRSETFVASVFNSSTKTAVPRTFQLQAEAANNNTATASGTLNLLYGTGTGAPAETGLKISSKGVLTFAAGQVFSGNGSGLTNINATQLGGIAPSGFAELAAANVFSKPQKIQSIVSGGGNLLTVNNGSADQFTVDNMGNLFMNGVIVAGNDINTSGSLFAGGMGITGTSTFNGNTSLQTAAGNTVAALTVVAGDATPTTLSGGTAIVAMGGANSQAGYNVGLGGSGIEATGGTGLFTGVETSYGPGVGGVFTGGSCTSCGGGDGIWAYPGTESDGQQYNFAGNFFGNVEVDGTLTSSAKSLKIDHPVDPANKYLVHASVESSEMMNIYSGNVATDGEGEATVQLPNWFEAENSDFRYQLTVVGQFAQAIVGREIADHQFVIRTNVPNVKVSWQVTGVRQDAYAKAHPLVVEEEKDARTRGFYIHPELFGALKEKGIGWARHPELMRRVQRTQQQQLQKPETIAAAANSPQAHMPAAPLVSPTDAK